MYHNPNKYSHSELHSDLWLDSSTPYASNESDVYLKFEIDDEAVKKYEEQKKQAAADQVSSHPASNREGKEEEDKEEEEVKEIENMILPGEKPALEVNPDQILICFAPFPTSASKDVLPRYLCRMNS